MVYLLNWFGTYWLLFVFMFARWWIVLLLVYFWICILLRSFFSCLGLAVSVFGCFDCLFLWCFVD